LNVVLFESLNVDVFNERVWRQLTQVISQFLFALTVHGYLPIRIRNLQW